MSREAITLENLSWIRSHRMNNLFNLQPFPSIWLLRSPPVQEGRGRTIVEQTPINMGRSPEQLGQVSRATGIHIIMGTAYYRETQLYRNPTWTQAGRPRDSEPIRAIHQYCDGR